MKRFFALAFVFLLLAGIVGGLGYFQFIVKPEMIRGFIKAGGPPPATVAVEPTKAEQWATTVPAIGTLRATLGVDIAPQVGGVIRAIHFDSGQDVAKGEALIELDDAVEQADLKSNSANLKNAELALDRQRQLIGGGATTRATLDTAQAARDQAAAAADRTRALIAQKAIAAPFAGRLGLRKIDVGQYVSPGTVIVTLQKLDPIFVDFPLPEQNLAAVKVDTPFEAGFDAYPGQVFKGKVRSIDARVSADTRSFLVRGEIANPDKRLRPGMFADVTVFTGAERQVVTAPRTAVSFSLYGDSVYVVKPAPPPSGSAQAAPAAGDQVMVVERRPVKTGAVRGDRVALTEGVSVGERLVTEGQLKLQPNARVRVDNAAALPPPPTTRPLE